MSSTRNVRISTSSYASSYSSYYCRRDSSSQSSQSSQCSSPRQRPRLLRSSVTEPSITAIDCAHGSLVTPHSSGSASAMLSRVAIESLSSSPAESAILHDRRSASEILADSRYAEQARADEAMALYSTYSSGGYFSFPTFELWDEPKADDEKDGYQQQREA